LGVSGDSTLKQITATGTTTNTFNLDGNMNVSSTCEITDTLTVNGTTTITGDSTISSNLKINTSSTDSSTLNINGTLKVSGNTTFNTLTLNNKSLNNIIGNYNFIDLYNIIRLLKLQVLLNGPWYDNGSNWIIINYTSFSIYNKTSNTKSNYTIDFDNISNFTFISLRVLNSSNKVKFYNIEYSPYSGANQDTSFTLKDPNDSSIKYYYFKKTVKEYCQLHRL